MEISSVPQLHLGRQYLIQQPFYTSSNEIAAQQPSVAVTPATKTCVPSEIPTCNKKFNTHRTPQSPNVVSVILIAAAALRADPRRATFLLKAVACDSVVLTRKSSHPSFPCARRWTRKSRALWRLKFVSAQNENSFQGWGTTPIASVLGPQEGAGGEEERGPGWAAELVIPHVGRRRAAGRGAPACLCPRPHAPPHRLCPSSAGGFLSPAPARQSRGAWLLAAALPFLRANSEVPIMQTRGLTHRLLTCPSGYKTRAHHFNMGSFSAINAHLMSYCEVFNTCKSLSWGPVSWRYPHSSQNSTGIACQKMWLSHRIHSKVCLYYSHNWWDCNTA